MRNKKEYNRQSIRLKGYNYSQEGYYFITICVKNRPCIFGSIQDGVMLLNEYGKIAQDYWYQINKRYEPVRTEAFTVLPNHIHGIIEIKTRNSSVRAIHELPLRIEDRPTQRDKEITRKLRRKMLLPKIVGWYKMNVAKEVNKRLGRTGNPFWHRNYYEHIIRNEESLFQIKEYIRLNPLKWNEDRFFLNQIKNEKLSQP